MGTIRSKRCSGGIARPRNRPSGSAKPVDPLLGRAIAEWEKVRPEQPWLPDQRTGEVVPLLFAVRAKRVSKTYLNLALIPALYRKAGVPEE